MQKEINNVELHKQICKQINELYEKKNNDYGSSVNETFKKFGIDAYLIRMYDKLNRLYTLTRSDNKQKVNNESIEDTLLDLSNYAIITLIELKNERNDK